MYGLIIVSVIIILIIGLTIGKKNLLLKFYVKYRLEKEDSI
jgi:hypothetical protein